MKNKCIFFFLVKMTIKIINTYKNSLINKHIYSSNLDRGRGYEPHIYEKYIL